MSKIRAYYSPTRNASVEIEDPLNAEQVVEVANEMQLSAWACAKGNRAKTDRILESLSMIILLRT